MPEPDCFLRYRIGYETSQPCLGCQRAALLCGILRRENPTYGAPLERAVVLKWFYSLSRRKAFVRGKCALPSALLVVEFYRNLRTLGEDCNFTIFATTSLYHETSKVTLKSDNTFFAKVNGTDTGRTDRQMDEG